MAKITPPIPQDKIGENFVWRDWFQRLSDKVFGTMGTQDSTNVSITGGTIDGTSIGATTPSTGVFTSVDTALLYVPTGTDGQLLIGKTSDHSFIPATLTAGSNITITNAANAITIASTSGSGTVTSVAATVPTFLSVSGSPITTSGTLAITLSGTALPIVNGGSGQTTAQLGMNAFAGAVTSGSYLRGNGTNVVMNTIQVADVPTLNQSTTGSAATFTTGRTISITGDLAYTSTSFDGSANVTAAGTLATVNTDVGSFTNTSLTVNAKGLITAASSGTAPVTSVTGTAPVVSSGGTTPAISMAAATTSVNGYLTSTDWTTFNNKGSGTVTAVSVVSANGFAGSSSGGATPALTLSTSITGVLKGNATAISAATVGTDYSVGTSALATGILKSTTATGALSIAVAADFPTLNQNTTGSAATLTTPRAIYGNNFDGSAALTQIVASTYGGTGNGFTKFSGATTTEKTYSLPDATTTILTTNAAVTILQGGTGQTTAGAAFNALAPVTTTGDLIIGNGTNSSTRLAIGANNYVLTSNGTTASWAVATGSGATITNDTSTSTNLYPLFSSATSGALANVYTGNANYLFKPSTGELTALAHVSSNGIQINATTVATSYTIATGNNGLSAGPVSINTSVTVTISTGSVWTVV